MTPRPTSFASAFEPVAIIDRSGADESVHHGAAVALDRDGAVVFAVGAPDAVVYPRSSNKPMQADAMVRAGLTLTPAQLALACASHDGTPAHVAIAREILAAAGLDEGALGNTPGLPLDPSSAERVLAAGDHRRPLYMNCSGKHAAMAATCVVNGWPVDSYLETDHPLQVAITHRISELCGGVAHIGVDGCGAPAHALTLHGLAAGFRTIAMARGTVWRAMTEHPEVVGGERRHVTRLMRAIPESIAKDGAEGVFAAALPDGRAAAVKIADGSSRPAAMLLAAALRSVGIDVDPVDFADPALGHGEPVGALRLVVRGSA